MYVKMNEKIEKAKKRLETDQLFYLGEKKKMKKIITQLKKNIDEERR